MFQLCWDFNLFALRVSSTQGSTGSSRVAVLLKGYLPRGIPRSHTPRQISSFMFCNGQAKTFGSNCRNVFTLFAVWQFARCTCKWVSSQQGSGAVRQEDGVEVRGVADWCSQWVQGFVLCFMSCTAWVLKWILQLVCKFAQGKREVGAATREGIAAGDQGEAGGLDLHLMTLGNLF